MGEKKFLDPDEKPLDAIERALLKRALGFHQQEIHTEEMIDKNSGEVLETARRRSVTKEVKQRRSARNRTPPQRHQRGRPRCARPALLAQKPPPGTVARTTGG